MNKQELIGKYEYLNHDCFRRVDTSEVLKDLKQLDEPQKLKIPQFVADWIEECSKNLLGFNLKSAMNVNTILHYSDDGHKVIDWIKVDSNQEKFARAWLDGYEVEEEKRYSVKIKSTKCSTISLVFSESTDVWLFSATIYQGLRFKHTRKQLEEANFGWVFDCEGIEIEEV